MHYSQRTSYGDGKSVTDEGHVTERLRFKLENLYGIALEKNVD